MNIYSDINDLIDDELSKISFGYQTPAERLEFYEVLNRVHESTKELNELLLKYSD